MAETLDAARFVDALRRALPGVLAEAGVSTDMPTVYVARDHLVDACRWLRDDPDMQFAFLADVTAVDYLPVEPRYEVVYHLASLGEAYAGPGGAAPARRLRLKVPVPGDDPRVPTVSDVYPTAGWTEREVFDLFGIAFDGHPDLRRILMPEDWEGYPLRKDYAVQIKKATTSWQPIQLSVEEFAENVRARREGARRAQAPPAGPEPAGRE